MKTSMFSTWKVRHGGPTSSWQSRFDIVFLVLEIDQLFSTHFVSHICEGTAFLSLISPSFKQSLCTRSSPHHSALSMIAFYRPSRLWGLIISVIFVKKFESPSSHSSVLIRVFRIISFVSCYLSNSASKSSRTRLCFRSHLRAAAKSLDVKILMLLNRVGKLTWTRN